MEITHKHLHGWCPLYVYKNNRITCTGPAKQPCVFFSHCFLQRGCHFKTAVPELQKVLNQTIESRPSNLKLFSALCFAIESAHTQLLLHTEVKWLSRERMLSWFHELREEVHMFLTAQKSERVDLIKKNVMQRSRIPG